MYFVTGHIISGRLFIKITCHYYDMFHSLMDVDIRYRPSNAPVALTFTVHNNHTFMKYQIKSTSMSAERRGKAILDKLQ